MTKLFCRIAHLRAQPTEHLTENTGQKKSAEMDLSFDFPEEIATPSGPRPVAQMIDEIRCFEKRLAGLSPRAVASVEEFVRRMEAVNFVAMSNKLEMVGTLDAADTQELCENDLRGQTDVVTEQRQLETLGTFKALRLVSQNRAEMLDGVSDLLVNPQTDDASFPPHPLDSLLLTTTLIQDTHRVLLAGVRSDAGCLRTTEAKPSDRLYFYAKANVVASELQYTVDLFNETVLRLRSLEGWTLHAKLMKLAAWLLFEFLEVHPFGDGNGRMARILANNVLSYFHPVAVSILSDEFASARRIYLDSIRSTERSPSGRAEPVALSGLVLSSVWASWRRIFAAVARWELERGLFIGQICLRARCFPESELRKRFDMLAHSSRHPARSESAKEADWKALLKAAENRQSLLEFDDGAFLRLTHV